MAAELGWVPPEGLGFRCPSNFAFLRPLRPPRFRLYAALRLSLCPASRPRYSTNAVNAPAMAEADALALVFYPV